ncbi:unnamed protein product [Amoebophrya sp. A25]|nr:unnamed protein product [Amoebophrya sp. A25]|eukprot:GSA25T00014770001.1
MEVSGTSSSRSLCVITGASRGIGKAIVQALLQSGTNYTVIGSARSASLMSPSSGRGEDQDFIPVQGDLTQASTIAKIREAVGTRTIDLLVHNAGNIEPIRPCLMPESEGDGQRERTGTDTTGTGSSISTSFRSLFDINFFSAVELMEALGPCMSPTALVMFMSSAAAGPFVTQGWAGYCASKAALLQYARILALENSFKVISFGPGIVDTDMQKRIRETHRRDQEGLEAVPGGREGLPVVTNRNDERQASTSTSTKTSTKQDPGFLSFLNSLHASGDMRTVEMVSKSVLALFQRRNDAELRKFFTGEFADYQDVEPVLFPGTTSS